METPSVEKTHEEPPMEGVAAVAGWFGAVSIVLTMHKENGRLNIWNELSQMRASTRDAAIGFAVREALKRNPGHQVHCLTATEFSPLNTATQPTATNANPKGETP